jgi:uncharacterized membrane protein YhdT
MGPVFGPIPLSKPLMEYHIVLTRNKLVGAFPPDNKKGMGCLSGWTLMQILLPIIMIIILIPFIPFKFNQTQ